MLPIARRSRTLFRNFYAASHSSGLKFGQGAQIPQIQKSGPQMLYPLGKYREFSTLGDGPDTHDDFKPINKAPSDSPSAHQLVEKDIKENTIMIYMKGVPNAPQCGFSALAVNVLKQHGVPFSARNILMDPELKQIVKSFSNWPTFPQIFIKGEFVGGSDIILEMHKSGELKRMLERETDKQA